jgi:hypothetical protein
MLIDPKPPARSIERGSTNVGMHAANTAVNMSFRAGGNPERREPGTPVLPASSSERNGAVAGCSSPASRSRMQRQPE